LLLLVLVAAASGCGPEYDSCFRSRGPTATVQRSLGGAFHSLEVTGPIDLELAYDSLAPGQVELTGAGNLLEFVETEVRDSTLRIRVATRCNWARNLRARYTLHLTLPPLRNLALAGTVRATTPPGAFVAVDGEATWLVTGTEDHSLCFEQAPMLEVAHKGLGNLTLTGEVGVLVPVLEDAGSLDARACHAGYTYLFHYGIGDCWVWAEKELAIWNYNRGRAYYGGQPWTPPQLVQKGTGPIARYD
jgi:hypothetical protein